MKVFEALDTHYTRCCATCKHWERLEFGVTGRCAVNSFWEAVQESPNPWYGQATAKDRTHTTLDLALCSKWQHKEDAE